MSLLVLLLLQFQVTRGELPFTVAAAPAFDVRPGPLTPAAAGNEPEHLVTVARDRAAREGRVLVVWVGFRDAALAKELPPAWLQAGPVPAYGGERGPGVAVGVPSGGRLYYRHVILAKRELMDAEVERLSPARANPLVPPPVLPPRVASPAFGRPRGGNC